MIPIRTKPTGHITNPSLVPSSQQREARPTQLVVILSTLAASGSILNWQRDWDRFHICFVSGQYFPLQKSKLFINQQPKHSFLPSLIFRSLSFHYCTYLTDERTNCFLSVLAPRWPELKSFKFLTLAINANILPHCTA